MAPPRGWRWLLCVVVVALAAALLADRTVCAADIGSAPSYGSFGSFGPNPLGMLGSLTIQNAVHDATGTVFVLENQRISKFDRDGHALLSWSCNDCYGMDVSQSTGDVYVTQQNLNYVLQYSSSGTFVRQFGGPGAAAENLNRPHGIAVDPTTGNVYVFDTAAGRIKVFSGSGTYLRSFGQPGFGAGDFSGVVSPGGVAFDAVNRWVYVTDPPRYRVLKFAEDGTFLTKWGDPISLDPGHLRWCRSVEVDGSGIVYVTDTDSERIQYFTSDGTYLGQFHGPNDLVNGPFHPRDIAINRLTGEKYVNAAYAFREDKFDASNVFVKSFGGKNKDGSFLDAPQGVAVSPVNGDVYVVDSGDFLLKRFSAGGAFRQEYGGSNSVDTTLPGLVGQGTQSALAVEADGSFWSGIIGVFYPTSPPVPWIYRYSTAGTVTNFFTRKPSGGVYEEQVRDIAIEPATGDLFVADASFNRLKRITQAGVTAIDLPVAEAGGLVFANGKLFMTDFTTGLIRRYSANLTPETSFGGPGNGDGSFLFSSNSGLAATPNGHLIVADTFNHRIQEITTDGAFIAKRGTAGTAPGQFLFPADVAVSSGGDVVYVADTLNHRIDMFCLGNPAACDAAIDADADGLRDSIDNCFQVPNPTQTDGDADGVGDACDACANDPANDVDGDGVCGNADNCPVDANPDQADSDGNGVGDVCDTCPAAGGDADGDHVCSANDNCPFAANAGQQDSGGIASTTPDTIGDACQCGDVQSNGVVDAGDVAAYRGFLASDPTTTLNAPAKCGLSAQRSDCSILDVVILERTLAPGGPYLPGILQTCPAAVGP